MGIFQPIGDLPPEQQQALGDTVMNKTVAVLDYMDKVIAKHNESLQQLQAEGKQAPSLDEWSFAAGMAAGLDMLLRLAEQAADASDDEDDPLTQALVNYNTITIYAVAGLTAAAMRSGL